MENEYYLNVLFINHQKIQKHAINARNAVPKLTYSSLLPILSGLIMRPWICYDAKNANI
jgi:hypothetical protein